MSCLHGTEGRGWGDWGGVPATCQACAGPFAWIGWLLGQWGHSQCLQGRQFSYFQNYSRRKKIRSAFEEGNFSASLSYQDNKPWIQSTSGLFSKQGRESSPAVGSSNDPTLVIPRTLISGSGRPVSWCSFSGASRLRADGQSLGSFDIPPPATHRPPTLGTVIPLGESVSH